MDIVSRHPAMPVLSRFTRFEDLPDDVISYIASRLSLRDFVRFQHVCSSTKKEIFRGDFRGDPFFLRETCGEINKCWFYSVTMRKWILLKIPIQDYPPRWRPINESRGLVLYSGVGSSRDECFMRRRWPIVVINPINPKKVRHLLFGLEFPPEVDKYTIHRRFLYNVQMALKVNSDSSYKVVVHLKHSFLVQIFDSLSNRWSVVTLPKELRAYSESSNDFVFCRSFFRSNDHQGSMYDIKNNCLVDCNSIRLRTGVISGDDDLLPEHIIQGFPYPGTSCLYAFDYNAEDPITSIQVYKKERLQVYWKRVAEVPLDLLCFYLEVQEISHVFLRHCRLVIHECGELLFLSFTYRTIWCGMLFDLENHRWISHIILDQNRGNLYNDGIFFQPQLNICP